jgi:hypothetical protein
MKTLLVVFFVLLNGGVGGIAPPAFDLPEGWVWLDTNYTWVMDDKGERLRWVGDINGHRWLFSLE